MSFQRRRSVFVVGICFGLAACGGGGTSGTVGAGASGIASHTDGAMFTLVEQANPLDSVFGLVTTNFNALNGSPLVQTNGLSGSASFIGSGAIREGGTGTLFSGVFRMNFDYNSDTGVGRLESLSVSHSPSESRFIDGTLPIIVTTIDNGSYDGQITGTLTETGLSPRGGLSYTLNGTVDGSLVSANVGGFNGTRTLGTISGTIDRSTGETNPADGLFFANF